MHASKLRSVEASQRGTEMKERSESKLSVKITKTKPSRMSQHETSGLASCQSEEDLELNGPIETNQKFDGWKLYKRLKVPAAPVRRYQNLVDEDYQRNKITVCAHFLNIFNSFVVSRGRHSPNFFDIERWTSHHQALLKHKKSRGLGKMKGTPFHSSVVTLPREFSATNDNGFAATFQNAQTNNSLLTKTHSTEHIPLPNRSKEARRAYANFDKEVAH